MKNPAAPLYDDLERIDATLEPFKDPQINDHPGLRWMHQTLTERRTHLLEQIEQVERSALTVTIAPVAADTPPPSADVIAELLAVVQEEVRAAAGSLEWPEAWPEAQRDAATTLHVGSAGDDDGQWSIELRRPAGPLAGQPTTPGGDSLVFDVAVMRLLDRIDGGDAARLARLVVDLDLPLTLTATASGGDSRTLQLDQQHAQALLLRTDA